MGPRRDIFQLHCITEGELATSLEIVSAGFDIGGNHADPKSIDKIGGHVMSRYFPIVPDKNNNPPFPERTFDLSVTI